jgi:hypothetical protein
VEIDLVVTSTEHQSIPMLNLTDVYKEHGPGVGWDELQRRSICPPTRRSEMNLDTEIRREVGHLSLTTDYVELSH